jgi:hypothetical protein
MFNGLPVVRNDGVVESVVTELTRPHFYQLDAQQQTEICHAIEQGTIRVVPCHRQQGFDFSQVFQTQPWIITVVVDDVDFLSNRFNQIHLKFRDKIILNPVLEQIRQQATPDQLHKIIKKDYEIWARSNHKSTDIEFHLSWLDCPEQVKDFCTQHQLNYSDQWVTDIVNDMNFYRTSHAV